MKKWKTAAIPIVSGIIAFLFFVAAIWLPLQPYGSSDLLIISTIGMFGWMTAIVIGGISLFFCIPKKTRRISFMVFICSASIVVFSVLGARFGGMVRMKEFERLAERSIPLVQATRSFVETEKRLPNELDDLIPKYLAKIPKTGMGAYPDYELVIAKDGKSIDGNDWILMVHCPLGILNWNEFLYYPNGNYPKYGYGGYLVRIKDWAYVHE